MSSATLIQRLERRHVLTPVGCWEWQGTKNKDGYGQIWFKGQARYVHRIAYALLVGEIPDGLVIDHLCRTRACFNPEHLRACTDRENTHAPGSKATAAANAAKTRCKYGHPFDAGNTYIRPDGERCCRTCRREADRLARAARRA